MVSESVCNEGMMRFWCDFCGEDGRRSRGVVSLLFLGKGGNVEGCISRVETSQGFVLTVSTLEKWMVH